ncbi:MAG: DNA translocase FtsK [Candidatus Izemoplasmatales bacterium]
MLFRKKRVLERIVPGVERTPDTRTFFIPKIADLEDKETMKRRFVSPIFGKQVKDDVVVPHDRSQSGDIDKKYDAFRTKKVLTKEEAKKRYGDSYYEFQTINNADKHRLLKGEITPEYLAARKKEAIAEEAAPTPAPAPEEHVSIDAFFSAVNKPRTDDPYAGPDAPEDFTMEHPEGDLGADRFGPIDEEEQDHVLFPEPGRAEPESAPAAPDSREPIVPIFADERPATADDARAEKARASVVTDFDDFRLPPLAILRKAPPKKEGTDAWIARNIDTINQTLIAFGIAGSVVAHTKGPSVTRYEIALDAGVQTKRITAIADNFQMSLRALSIRIEAPIPGKNTVGIEVPNEIREPVYFGDVVDNPKFIHSTDPLLLAIGLDIDANPVYTSIEGMPHGLVAGSTQSGKSVCIAAIIASLIFRNKPDQVKLLLIDPKKVDLQQFADLPHLVTPIIDDPKLAVEALKWAVGEMERRYDVLKHFRTVNVKDYYERRSNDPEFEKMPRLVVIVEEASDLLISGGPEVEENVLKLTQKSRAVGIHLILATQRPSADILKGSIKANIPTRFAFKVPSSTDSMVVLDTTGAEKLLGKGDMLLSENGLIRRLQGAFLSTEEIESITSFIKDQAYPAYLFTHESLVKNGKDAESAAELDDLFAPVARFVVTEEKCSLNKITQEFAVGFNRATQIVASLELYGIVSANVGTKPREVIVTPQKLEEILEKLGRR